MLKALLQEANKAEPVKVWETYDGKILPREEYLTASEVGNCLRQTYFDKQFPAKGFWGNGYAERGHSIEAYWVNKLRGSTALIHFMGDEQRSFYDPDIGVSATPDGLIKIGDEWVLLDFKSIDPRTNRNNLPKRKHVLQVTLGIYLVNSCRPEYNVKKAILCYIDASDIWDVTEFEIPYDGELIKEILDRADRLWTAKSPEDLPAEGIIRDDCEYCSHHARCSGQIELMKKLEVAKKGTANFLDAHDEGILMPLDAVDELAHYVELHLLYKQAEKDLEAMKENVKGIIRVAGGKLILDGVKVSYDEHPGKRTIDQDAMLDAGLNPDDFRKQGAPYGVLKITPPKEK